MGIFNALSQIAKNKNNFETWEENQNDAQAQRDELNRRREHKQQEIKAAQDLGKTIIDVVDIMDQHSEDIAENVETVTEPLVGLAPFLALFGTGFLTYKGMFKPAMDRGRELYKEFIESTEVIRLTEEIEAAQELKFPADMPLEEQQKLLKEHNANNLNWDKYSITSKHERTKLKKSLPELGNKADAIYKRYKKQTAFVDKKQKWALIIPFIASIGAFIGSSIYTTKLQVDSSKVARFQARKILEDPKYFVNYTPEQIAQAKETLKNDPEYKKAKKKKLKTDKLKGGMIKGLISVIKDNKEYKAWKKTDVDESQKVNRALCDDEIEQAKKDKEVIQRVVRVVNNKAEIYSENMEMTANVIMGTTPFLGAFAGAVVSNIMNWTKAIPNFIDKTVKELGSDKAKAAYENMKKYKEGQPGFDGARNRFIREMTINDTVREMKADGGALKEGVKKASKKGRYAKDAAIKNAKKYIAALLTAKMPRRMLFGVIGTFVSTIAGSLIALKLQKASSRAGRFVAKRELEQDPKNFIGYTEKDHEEVKDIKAEKKTFSQKVKESLMFIPNVMKQYYAYQKYKKTELLEEKMLKEELTKLDVTPEQLKHAKNLQRKVFNTFERVDDKSQEYSESMEAAVEIAQPFVQGAGILVMMSPLIYLGIQAKNGKLKAKSLINKALTILSGSSKITDSKMFKKYLNDIAKQMPYKVQNVEANGETWSKLLNGINIKETPIIEIMSKFSKNSKEYIQNFASLTKEEQTAVLRDIKNMLAFDSPFREKLNRLIYMDETLRSTLLNIVSKPASFGKEISKLDKDKYSQFLSELECIYKGENFRWMKADNTFDVLRRFDNKALGNFADIIMNRESLKKVGNMAEFEYVLFQKDTIAPIQKQIQELFKHAKSNLSHYTEGSSGYDKYFADAKLYSGLENVMGLLGKANKKDFGLMADFLADKKMFLKNLAKLDDADFNRVKGYFTNLTGMFKKSEVGQSMPHELLDFIEKIEKMDKASLQANIDELFAFAEKIKSEASISFETFKTDILPRFKKLAEKLGLDEFKDVTTMEEFAEAFKKCVGSGMSMAREMGAPSKLTEYIEKNAAQILAHPEKLAGDIKKIKIGDLIGDFDTVKWLEKQEAKIKGMSDEQVFNYMQKLENKYSMAWHLNVTEMDKAYILDSIGKLKKVIAKMPKEEMKNIMNAMIKEFNEHPDQFIAYVRSGKIMNIYKTPALEKAAAAAGISWIAINVAVTYAIEAILADLQLKAGRLGVMKALDSLDDPAYYANIEVDEQMPSPSVPVLKVTDVKNNSSLLQLLGK